MKTLRPYQTDAVVSTLNRLDTDRITAVVMPTSAGKTLCMCHVANAVLKENSDNAVVILSHLSVLIKQTMNVMSEEFGTECHILRADVIPPEDARVVVTTMQSFRNIDKIVSWGGGSRVKLLIVDESHFLGTNSYTKILEMFPNAKVMAVTATPFRKNKLMSNMFDSVAFTISAQELIDQKYIVPPTLRYYRFDTENIVAMSRQVATIYKENHNGHKVIVYLRSISDCNTMRNMLVDAGIRAEAVTSKLTDVSRETVLEDFKNNTTSSASVLVTVDVLTAGFDSPNVRAIIMPYRIGSVTTYIQRIGRGLRLDEGKTDCKVYVGGDNPRIVKGFWERINKKALALGERKKRDETITDREEYLKENKELMSKQEITWNKAVCDMAKDMRKMRFDNIAKSIMAMDFPKEFLDKIVSTPPHKQKSYEPATDGQKRFLYSIGFAEISKNCTKQEATYLLNRYREIQGRVQDWEVVPMGLHKGKMWGEVPHVYKKFVLDGRDGDLKKSYLAWKERIKSK